MPNKDRKKRQEYQKQWRKKNNERLKELERRRQQDPKRRAKRLEYQRGWYAKNPDYFREKRKRNSEWFKIYRNKWRLENREKRAGKKRPEVCEICEENGKIVFDHNHNTGKFRGWICGKCNVAIGMVSEDTDKLFRIIKYLESRNGR